MKTKLILFMFLLLTLSQGCSTQKQIYHNDQSKWLIVDKEKKIELNKDNSKGCIYFFLILKKDNTYKFHKTTPDVYYSFSLGDSITIK